MEPENPALCSHRVVYGAVTANWYYREAGRWMRKTGPYPIWHDHSKYWEERLVKVIKPKVVIVFGDKASKAFYISWEDVEHNHGGGHQTFAVSTFQGAPAVFCHHLSRYVESEALKCFSYAKRLISEGS